ncbi:hypothetical protein H4R34_000521 [Dimargaris verticillata]|uniref:Alkaline-phosphatase-like protein n=1 Tax=Dimargaris verticillata TaxID=2761393 RepID=A0A9W8EFV6_9FUNG|nr:hypothetical protein H4R34_000521 [Dimargaris verticillata]
MRIPTAPDDSTRVHEPFLDEAKSQGRTLGLKAKVAMGLFGVALLIVAGLSFSTYSDQSIRRTPSQRHAPLLSNGTHQFRKTVILVSFDGFRADYLNRGLTPHLLDIETRGGFRAEFLTPSFPSVTFPNHYTLVTGMYPEAHGIIGNEFYDPTYNDTFYYKNDAITMQSRWWGGEPIWVTAEKHGHISAIDMWPGSLAKIKGVVPTHVIPYKSGVTARSKIDQLMAWLNQPLNTRPSFLATYVPEVDSMGHTHSPDSAEVNAALATVDQGVGYLRKALEARNLTHIVNVVYVSDHGMASVPPTNILYLDELIDLDQVRWVYGYPLAGIVPKDDQAGEAIFKTLQEKSVGQHWAVYHRESIPTRFHFSNNDRIPPIVCIPEVGWTFYTRNQYDYAFLYTGEVDRVVGVHGYDNLDPTMRAIFLAYGPDFGGERQVQAVPLAALSKSAIAMGPKARRSSAVRRAPHPAFSNVEVYNLLCHLLDIPASANNGTLAWQSIAV